LIKEGRNERKSCHQIIVEVEKLLYKMNSVLVSEHMRYDGKSNADDEKALSFN